MLAPTSGTSQYSVLPTPLPLAPCHRLTEPWKISSRFKEKFDEFHRTAEEDVALLETEFDMMQKRFVQVSDLFTFEVNKYSQEDFFRDINEFIALYKVSVIGFLFVSFFFLSPFISSLSFLLFSFLFSVFGETEGIIRFGFTFFFDVFKNNC